jgi:hypothetical protein
MMAIGVSRQLLAQAERIFLNGMKMAEEVGLNVRIHFSAVPLHNVSHSGMVDRK